MRLRLHVMQRTWLRRPFCPLVCPSVCQTREHRDKTKASGAHILIFTQYEKRSTYSFPTWRTVGGDISSRCITRLELIAIRHPSIFFSVCLPSTTENISFSPVFSWHCALTTLRPRGLRNSFAILATLKIFDWHWHWHWHIVPVRAKLPIFNRYSRYERYSAVTPSEKSSITTNSKSATSFPMRLRRTVYVATKNTVTSFRPKFEQ